MTSATLTVLPPDANRYARVAGAGYLLIILAGVFAEFYVRSSLIVPGDASTTATNVLASQTLFRFSIVSDLIMLACDALVAVALYVLLRLVSKALALLAMGFRLVHTAVYGANLLNLVSVVLLLSGAGYLAVFEPGHLHALVLLFLEAHQYGYALGLVFFGFHCLVLGYLLYKSGYFPKVLGILMVIASLGYLADSFAHVLLADYMRYETVFIAVVFVPAFVAELSLCLWLLLKGVK